MGGLVFAPHFLFWKPEGRPLNEHLHMSVPVGSLVLALLLMSYNYAWLQSARLLTVGLTNDIFQTSVAFVYLAGVAVFKDN